MSCWCFEVMLYLFILEPPEIELHIIYGNVMSVSWGHELRRGSCILNHSSPSALMVVIDVEAYAQLSIVSWWSKWYCRLYRFHLWCLFLGWISSSGLGQYPGGTGSSSSSASASTSALSRYWRLLHWYCYRHPRSYGWDWHELRACSSALKKNPEITIVTPWCIDLCAQHINNGTVIAGCTAYNIIVL